MEEFIKEFLEEVPISKSFFLYGTHKKTSQIFSFSRNTQKNEKINNIDNFLEFRRRNLQYRRGDVYDTLRDVIVRRVFILIFVGAFRMTNRIILDSPGIAPLPLCDDGQGRSSAVPNAPGHERNMCVEAE